MKRNYLKTIIIVLLLLSTAIISANDKWEYMVISFGKADFSQYLSKTMAYWDEGISKETYGAYSYEKNLDILGAHGWEVTSVTGAIGGDQQVMLKRKYDKKRTEKEIEEIDKNSTLAFQGLLDSLIAEDKKEDSKPVFAEPKLIELDEKDAKDKQAKEDYELAGKLDSLTNSYFGSLIKNKPDAWSTTYSRIGTSVVKITYDITKEYLLNGNAYRKSQVDGFLLSLEETVVNFPQFAHGRDEKKVRIEITANIIYSGKTFKVGSATYGESMWGTKKEFRL